MSKKKIGVLLGSQRKGSYSRSVAECVMKLGSTDFDFEIVELGDLPLYDQAYDEAYPDSYNKFKAKIKSLDALLFVTGEHNRSIPALLKNAIDIGSRPYGENVWAGKPGAIISQSIGGISGFGATHHLRQVLTFVDVLTMQQPECYLANIMEVVDENGKIKSEDTIGFLKNYMNAYAKWVNFAYKFKQ